jgi:hypothetical protein
MLESGQGESNMAFKLIDGLTESGNPRSLFRAIVLNTEQFKIVQDIINYFEGETKLTSKQLITANNVLRGKKHMPYFIGRNLIAKTKESGMYDLSKLKLSKAKETPVAPPSKKEKSTKPKGGTKKVASPKKGAKTASKRGAAPVVDDAVVAEMPSIDAVSSE